MRRCVCDASGRLVPLAVVCVVLIGLALVAVSDASSRPATQAPRLTVSGPAWDLRGKTLRGGLWTFDFTATTRELTSRLRVVVRINGRVHDRAATSCERSVCALTRRVELDTAKLPRGRLRVRVIANDDHLSTEVAFSVRSTPTSPRCPPQRYRVFFLGRRFAGLPFTNADQLCEQKVGPFGGVHDVTFIYGDCDASQGRCLPPLEVTSSPLCEDHPRLRADRGKRMWLLHVPARLYDQGGAWLLEIFTGHTTVAFAAADDTTRDRRRVLAAAGHLHYAPKADLPDGSRELRTLPADAQGPALRRLPNPNAGEFNSPTDC